jgi:hypothetical protein
MTGKWLVTAWSEEAGVYVTGMGEKAPTAIRLVTGGSGEGGMSLVIMDETVPALLTASGFVTIIRLRTAGRSFVVIDEKVAMLLTASVLAIVIRLAAA